MTASAIPATPQIRYHNPADNSFWCVDPPAGAVELSTAEVEAVTAAIKLGHLPRFEAGAWNIYTSDAPPLDVLMHNLRHERDSRLRACDWTQLPDAGVAPTQRQAWTDYRRDLRNLPQTHPDGKNVVWPAKPE